MSGLEVAAISLGAAVAKAACGIWLGDSKLASDVGNSVIDLAAERLKSTRDRRRFGRVWEEAAELIAGRVLALRELGTLPGNEHQAAIDAVRDTFDAAALTEDDLYRQDLDAGYLDRYLRGQDPDRAARAGLADGAVRLYDLLLRECCAYTIEVARALPGAGLPAVAELLRRDRQILDGMAKMLERLPERRGVRDFERDYRQLVANRLDRVEFFGVTLRHVDREYPLSVAYLGLTASTDPAPVDPVLEAIRRVTETMGGPPPGSVERLLADADRLFVRGEAGIGKTTLLRWIAVQCARGTFTDALSSWNDLVPFFLPLRRYATEVLPAPEAFLREVGQHIAEEMPPGWVHRHLRDGRAVVLVDGVDELADRRRDEVRHWLGELVATFPHARYVVTSRPAAARKDWLAGDDFTTAELEPMNRSQVPVFVRRWHDAMRSLCRTDDERDGIETQQRDLLAALDKHRHLRQLAGYPLLCALLCALHRDRHGQLPGNRMELYEVALHMLLERRDAERQVAAEPALDRTEQTLLLRDLAYRLIRNEWSDAPRADVLDWLGAKLAGMPRVEAEPEQVYRVLLERSGLLREQVEERVDFVHRSFQEYLAAAQAVAEGDYGVLEANAHLPQWHEVVVMAAGHAPPAGLDRLLRALLERADGAEPERGDVLRLVALACLETAPERSPDLEKAIREAAAGLVPPRSEAAAKALGRAGAFALDLLMEARPTEDEEVRWTVEAAAMTGDPAALPLLARFGTDERVAGVLLHAWPRFDPEEYAQTVLRDSPLERGWAGVSDHRLLPALRHLRRLSGLGVTFMSRGGPLDLSFVRQLRSLERLDVRGPLADLIPLDGQPLDALHLARFHKGLDLSPLATMRRLTDLTVRGEVRCAEVIPTLNLRTLVLNASTFFEICDLERGTGPQTLILYDVTDLAGMRTARFVPRSTLLLVLKEAATFEPVAGLALSTLNIIVGGLRPDLTPLRYAAAWSLRLSYSGTDPVDVRPLAGRADVVLNVPHGVAVLGGADLGPRSTVRDRRGSAAREDRLGPRPSLALPHDR